ncbi:MAG TPA: GNAT family N-acetyltransferase [Solirubrobacteraceae bacterium]|nr:GNAT family N-acetyltransferase [Solirubrobacteraceae bacterium]
MDEEQLDAHLDTVLIGGRERREIVIADYDPEWPRRFEAERERIGAALGGGALRIEHIGSTSVPGLAAKPIVDVLVAVSHVSDESSYGPALERAGYELRVREPEHRMYRTPARDVHVHVWNEGDPEVDRHLVFRDRLRASPDDRSEYERLKRSLAQRDWSDVNHYADSKGPLIAAILNRVKRSHIRRARSSDADAVAGLLGHLGYPTDVHAASAQLGRLLDRDDAGVLVYDDGGGPVGLITYHVFDLIYRPRPHCRITALAVSAQRRREGIARALLDAVQAIARERACFRIELTTRPDRADALRFYEACGFAERPRRLVKPL